MRANSKRLWFSATFLLAVFVSRSALGYGAQGHSIAGRVAEAYLCVDAKAQIETLGSGIGLAELGLWADRIRSIDRYQASRPWHYMNAETIVDFEHPPEGDVLWAIEHFFEIVADDTKSKNVRAEALKFLTHFVVDIHQPLHVGLAADRGGNRIEFRFNRRRTNLHQFWDTHAVRLAGLPAGRYARALEAGISQADVEAASRTAPDPKQWAAESLALRPGVYDLDVALGPSDAYVKFAEAVTKDRLRLSAMRLAAMLNYAFCR